MSGHERSPGHRGEQRLHLYPPDRPSGGLLRDLPEERLRHLLPSRHDRPTITTVNTAPTSRSRTTCFTAICNGGSSTSGAIQTGYNHTTRINNLVIVNNTFSGFLYGFDFNDITDPGTSLCHLTNFVCVNNIYANQSSVIATYSSPAAFTNRHVLEFDYNDNYNPSVYGANVGSGPSTLNNLTCATGFYQSGNKYNRLTGAGRNINGVALFDASYTTAQSGQSLVYTVNTLGQDHTLAWAGGTAQQLDHRLRDKSPALASGPLVLPARPTGLTRSPARSRSRSIRQRSPAPALPSRPISRSATTSGLLATTWPTRSRPSPTTRISRFLPMPPARNPARRACGLRTDCRLQWFWVVSGTGAGQARSVWMQTPNTCISLSIANGGGGYAVGQAVYVSLGSGAYDTYGVSVVFRVTSVSSGVITGLQLVTGGGYITTPGTTALATARLTGVAGTGCTVNATWAPGLFFMPDLSTPLDNTSVFAIVKGMVNLADSGSGNVWAGLYLPTPGSDLTSCQLPATSQTDTGIAVTVNKSVTGNPGYAAGSGDATANDYKFTSSSPCYNAGTSSNSPSVDYFGTTRPQGGANDIGFFELVSGGSACIFFPGFNGGTFDYTGGMG